MGPEFLAAFEGLSQTGRRELLKAMGAGLALAGLAGCTAAPHPDALPYVTQPDETVPGTPRHYATAVTFGGYSQPVLATTYEGRPIKLDGLPEHPACEGGSDAFTQAALLGLYDPDRSKAPRQAGRPVDWAAFDAAMAANAARLDGADGEGFRLLTGPTSSPTFARQLADLTARWPKARWHVFDPVGEDGRLAAARLAFGRPLELQPRFDACRAIVSFDDDLLGPGPRQTRNARAWSKARRVFQADGAECRLMVAEPAPTLTGSMAADRLAASAADVERLAVALAARLGVGGPPAGAFTARQAQWLDAAAAALARHPGAGLVLVGAQCDPAVQALALQLNGRLGALGKTVSLCDPILLQPPDGARSLEVLAADLAAGRVDTLAILDANPAYAAPADLAFVAAMRKARVRVHAGVGFDETAALCDWHAPLEHDLETWGDARAVDGRPALIQPLVTPFHAVRPRSVVLENLQGRMGGDARALLLATWKDRLGDETDPRWKKALALGFLDEPAAEVAATAVAPPAPSLRVREDGLTVLLRPDPTIWDGTYTNNSWLQELPKPFSKLTWDNAIGASPALATQLGVANGDVVKLSAGRRTIQGPVWITHGLERRTVVAHLGYGRRLPGQLADRMGYDAYALRTSAQPWRIEGATLTRAGGRIALACTQTETDLQGFDFVRKVAQTAMRPGPPPKPPPSFYPPKLSGSPQWGMAIDTDACIGCNACVTACDAENNVPMVGKDQVAKGRQMHWLRIDHYRSGAGDEPAFFHQPVPCMHCEQAPCEMGCPVNASVHTHDGLNMQVYNRCVGTRTCSSFCPYKVRRFNWFDFTAHDPPELRAARNPEVTVRSRGIMEKCNYCVQRIEKARIAAKIEDRPIRDGEVVTACQQACPTQAIQFGDVSDPTSAVSRLKAQQRNYALLEEVNTRPRTTYLARLDDGAADG